MIFKLEENERIKLQKLEEKINKCNDAVKLFKYIHDREDYLKELEEKRFNSFKSIDEILNNAYEQIPLIIKEYKIGQTTGLFNIRLMFENEGQEEREIIDNLLDIVKSQLYLHFKALEKDTKKTNILNQKIYDSLFDNNLIKIQKLSSNYSNISLFPVDKVNNLYWNLEKEEQEQTNKFNMLPQAEKKEAYAVVSIDFNNLEKEASISKKLDPYDRRVYIAVSSLFNVGNNIQTLKQIYRQMGNDSEPSKYDKEKIIDSIEKMAKAQIKIENKEEGAYWGKDYLNFVYDASLLPSERYTGYINGQRVDTAIHIFREPPLITFARKRKQITTIERNILNTPLNATPQNIKLEDYLIQRISRMKHDNKINSILLETIYNNLSISNKKQQKRALEKIETILNHFKECDYIKGYKIKNDKIHIDI